MPIYKNKTDEPHFAIDINGTNTKVLPNSYITTYLILDSDLFEKISETPYWNPFIQTNLSNPITLTPEGTKVTFDGSNANVIKIDNVTDKISNVFFSSMENIPAVYSNIKIGESITIEVLNMVDSIVLEGTGTCNIYISKKIPNAILNK